MKWPEEPLGNFIAECRGSVDPSKFVDEIFELYSIPAFDAGAPEICPGREIGSSKQIVQTGDVLLSRIVPHIRRAWLVGKGSGDRKIGSGEWIVFRTKRFDSDFLRMFLTSDVFHSQFMQTVSGVGGSLMRAKVAAVRNIKIPVPPMSEQIRFSKRFGDADTLRTLRARADARTAALVPALFEEMFGDPLRNARKWPMGELRELGRVVTGGTPPSVKENMFGGEIPFITPGDLERNTNATMRFVTEEGAQESRIVRSGSTLVCCIGATIGKTDRTWRRSAFNQQINAVEWAEQIDDDYGVECMKLCSNHVIRQNSSTALPILKKSLFEKIQIPVPPLDEQRTFASRVASLRALQAAQAASRARVEGLFQALVAEVFG